MVAPLDPVSAFAPIGGLTISSIVLLLALLVLFTRFDPWLMWKLFLGGGIVVLVATYLVYSFFYVVPAKRVSEVYYFNNSSVNETIVSYNVYAPNPYIHWLYIPSFVGVLMIAISILVMLWAVSRRVANVIIESV